MENNNLEIERKWLCYIMPDFSSVSNIVVKKTINQYYTDNGRYRKEWIDGDSITKYTHTIKNTISPGVNEEIETEINKSEFTRNINETVPYIDKIRYEWKDGEVLWCFDKIGFVGTMLLEAEVPTIDYPLDIPDFLQPYIYCEVTGDIRFNNSELSKHRHYFNFNRPYININKNYK